MLKKMLTNKQNACIVISSQANCLLDRKSLEQ